MLLKPKVFTIYDYIIYLLTNESSAFGQQMRITPARGYCGLANYKSPFNRRVMDKIRTKKGQTSQETKKKREVNCEKNGENKGNHRKKGENIGKQRKSQEKRGKHRKTGRNIEKQGKTGENRKKSRKQ